MAWSAAADRDVRARDVRFGSEADIDRVAGQKRTSAARYVTQGQKQSHPPSALRQSPKGLLSHNRSPPYLSYADFPVPSRKWPACGLVALWTLVPPPESASFFPPSVVSEAFRPFSERRNET